MPDFQENKVPDQTNVNGEALRVWETPQLLHLSSSDTESGPILATQEGQIGTLIYYQPLS